MRTIKALIIIDLQNDFVPGGSLEVPEGDTIIPAINALQKKFEIVVATQDWHPQNHKSFASNHQDKKVFGSIILDGVEQTLWPDHCIQGTKGAQFHPQLETNRIHAIFRKGMNSEVDSYSGFYENDHKTSTGLAGYLREKGISELYFCGLAADICVYFSIKDAIEAGFTSYLIEDASRPLDKENFQAIKKELLDKGVKIINSQEV